MSGITSKLNIRIFLYNRKTFLPLYFCRSSRYLIVKWPHLLLLLKLSNFGIFLSGIPSKLNIMNFLYNKKKFWPLYFCRSTRYGIIKGPLSILHITKIAEFFEWDLFQMQHKEILTMTKIVRQKERPLYFSGSFCQVIVKNSLCWIWKRSHSKKFQNSQC